MKLRKTLIILTALLMSLSLSACGADEKGDISETTQKPTATKAFSENEDYDIYKTTSVEKEENNIPSGVDNSETATEVTESVSSANPEAWTKSEIVEAYKKAAEKSNNNVKSEQIINLKNISINNGQYEGVIDFVMPIMSKLLSNNSKDTEGITGGYKNLVESDVSNAKAYAVGDKIAIEMTMRNQVDGAKSDPLSGSVGHAITAVGDISAVTKQLNDLGLPIKLSDKDTSIHYTNAKVKVLIDKDGNIVKGTWSYTVDIRINNYMVGNSTVESTSVLMDNIITVNGGF